MNNVYRWYLVLFTCLLQLSIICVLISNQHYAWAGVVCVTLVTLVLLQIFTELCKVNEHIGAFRKMLADVTVDVLRKK